MSMDNAVPGRLTDADRETLAGLSQFQRVAVRRAFTDWVEIARRAGYAPMDGWGSFLVEADHSALLNRLLVGKPPLLEPPSTKHGYPDYSS